MTPSPIMGVALHWLGGLAASSFYLPFRRVKRWSWETYWIVGGFFSWIFAPWVGVLALTHDFVGVLGRTPGDVLFQSWLLGALWGIGGLTFGLSMRYLGMSLGYGVALGTCSVCGTLLPPIVRGDIGAIAASSAGRITLLGIIVAALGIALSAIAGWRKERELPAALKQATIREFDFRKGMLVALSCGVLSACMAFALDAAAPLATLSAAAGTPPLWTGLPKLVVILAGGFCSNALWCFVLISRSRATREDAVVDTLSNHKMPWFANLLFCALAGVTWYLQFFFYTMGETQMGKFGFSSWTLHMASIVLFSTIWGLLFKEWRGTLPATRWFIAAGIAVLIMSTLIVGFGNHRVASNG